MVLTLGLGAPGSPLSPGAIPLYQKISRSLPCRDFGGRWSSSPAQAPCQEPQAPEVAESRLQTQRMAVPCGPATPPPGRPRASN